MTPGQGRRDRFLVCEITCVGVCVCEITPNCTSLTQCSLNENFTLSKCLCYWACNCTAT